MGIQVPATSETDAQDYAASSATPATDAKQQPAQQRPDGAAVLGHMTGQNTMRHNLYLLTGTMPPTNSIVTDGSAPRALAARAADLKVAVDLAIAGYDVQKAEGKTVDSEHYGDLNIVSSSVNSASSHGMLLTADALRLMRRRALPFPDAVAKIDVLIAESESNPPR